MLFLIATEGGRRRQAQSDLVDSRYPARRSRLCWQPCCCFTNLQKKTNQMDKQQIGLNFHTQNPSNLHKFNTTCTNHCQCWRVYISGEVSPLRTMHAVRTSATDLETFDSLQTICAILLPEKISNKDLFQKTNCHIVVLENKHLSSDGSQHFLQKWPRPHFHSITEVDSAWKREVREAKANLASELKMADVTWWDEAQVATQVRTRWKHVVTTLFSTRNKVSKQRQPKISTGTRPEFNL